MYLVAYEFGLQETIVKSGVNFENGKYYEVAVEVAPHTFSIGSEEKAYFSQGNLLYDGSRWYFHNNQYDRVYSGGDYTSYPMDLFCWGNVSNPAYNGEDYVTGMDVLRVNNGTDWGSNDIVNGGGTQHYWYTPEKEELLYILESRTGAATKYALGNVAGINGMIILPDDYAGPAVITNHADWSDNIITASSWVRHETYGAVFLPTAGNRSGSNIKQIDSDCQYWTATPIDNDGWTNRSYYLNIDAQYGILWMPTKRDEGRSVRLISGAN